MQFTEADSRSAFKLVSLSHTRRIFDVERANETAVSGRSDMDSHAETCCAPGENTRVLSFTGEHVNVSPFLETYQVLTDIPIASVATVWECPKTLKSFLLILHEALYFGKRLKMSLLCPNQLWDHGLQVNDTPTQFDRKSSHSIRIAGGIEMPLELDGVISFLMTRRLTVEEVRDYNGGSGLRSIVMTSDQVWDPYSKDFAEREEEARTISLLSVVKNKTIAQGGGEPPPVRMMDERYFCQSVGVWAWTLLIVHSWQRLRWAFAKYCILLRDATGPDRHTYDFQALTRGSILI